MIEEKPIKLLLHVCCGPCAALPVLGDIVDADSPPTGFYWRRADITGLFYNPNIHPESEFAKRMDGAVALFEKARLPLITKDRYMQSEWEQYEIANESRDPSGKYCSRCEMCYRIRLSYAAEFASENGFDAFSSTLLVSPYQNHEKIVSICAELAGQYKISFVYWDGRPRFREGQKIARDLGLYRQKYCGCIFSLPNKNTAAK